MKIDNVSQVESSQRVQTVESSKSQSVRKQQPRESKITKENKLDVDKDVQQIMTEEMMEKSVHQANKALKQHHRRIDRSVHDITKTVMYKMIDTETKEVIREFPPKKIQDMIAKMWELAGLFVDEEV
jgi:flagellar protein FlaG